MSTGCLCLQCGPVLFYFSFFIRQNSMKSGAHCDLSLQSINMGGAGINPGITVGWMCALWLQKNKMKWLVLHLHGKQFLHGCDVATFLTPAFCLFVRGLKIGAFESRLRFSNSQTLFFVASLVFTFSLYFSLSLSCQLFCSFFFPSLFLSPIFPLSISFCIFSLSLSVSLDPSLFPSLFHSTSSLSI